MSRSNKKKKVVNMKSSLCRGGYLCSNSECRQYVRCPDACPFCPEHYLPNPRTAKPHCAGIAACATAAVQTAPAESESKRALDPFVDLICHFLPFSPNLPQCRALHSVRGDNPCHHEACLGKHLCVNTCRGCINLTSHPDCDAQHPIDGPDGCHNNACRPTGGNYRFFCKIDCPGCPCSNRLKCCPGSHPFCGTPECKERRQCVAACRKCPGIRAAKVRQESVEFDVEGPCQDDEDDNDVSPTPPAADAVSSAKAAKNRLRNQKTRARRANRHPHCNGGHTADGADGCHYAACRGKKFCVKSCPRCPCAPQGAQEKQPLEFDVKGPCQDDEDDNNDVSTKPTAADAASQAKADKKRLRTQRNRARRANCHPQAAQAKQPPPSTDHPDCDGRHAVEGPGGCHNQACRGKTLCVRNCPGCPCAARAKQAVAAWHPDCDGRHPVDGSGGCHNDDCRGLQFCVKTCRGCPCSDVICEDQP